MFVSEQESGRRGLWSLLVSLLPDEANLSGKMQRAFADWVIYETVTTG